MTALSLQKLGTRAVIAEKLAREASKVEMAVGCLLDAAAAGDIQAAKALVPYFDQALGRPTERVEHRVPSTLQELEALSSEQLASWLRRAVSDGASGPFGPCRSRLNGRLARASRALRRWACSLDLVARRPAELKL